jgi:hypothetical protein
MKSRGFKRIVALEVSGYEKDYLNTCVAHKT